MKRGDIIYWVDIVLLLSFLTVAATGLVKFFFFLNGQTFGLPVRGFNTIHDYAGVTMVVATGAHIFLHWKSLWIMTKKKLGGK